MFAGSVNPLRWICVGMALRVVSWPMGYIVLAKNARAIFLLTEILTAVVHVGLAWVLIPRFGVAGATMAFAGLYVWHSVFIYVIARRMTGFRWSTETKRTGRLFGSLLLVVGCACLLGPLHWPPIVGILAVPVAAVYSLRHLFEIVPSDRLPSWLVALRDRTPLQRFGSPARGH
jgi:PST family polysaccharide transporter